MYINEIVIQNMVNFQGYNRISFSDTKSIPNDLYVMVGQNNSGKSSLLQLARACTDTDYLRKEWKNINMHKKKAEEQQPGEQPSGVQPSGEQSYGIVMCKMKDSVGKDMTAAFYKTPDLGVYVWAETVGGTDKNLTFMKMTNDKTEYLEMKNEGLPTVDLKYIIEKIKAAPSTNWKTQPGSKLPWKRESKPLVIQSDSQSIREGIIDYWRRPRPDVRRKVMDFIRRIGYAHYEVRNSETDNMAFTDMNTGLDFDIDKLPDGHQYLWSMAINMSLCCQPATNTTKCLIVDEPTRSMHPSLVHHLAAEMQDYCQKHELQFIICSHSPALVRALRLSNIFLATRMQDGTTNIRTLLDDESSSQAKQNRKFIVDKRIEDILFSRLVMIVKGETDRRLLSMLLSSLSRLNKDGLREVLCKVSDPHSSTTTESDRGAFEHLHAMTDEDNQRLSEFRSLLCDITVVAAGSIGQVAEVARHVESLGIPYFMVVDGKFVWETKNPSIKNKISASYVMEKVLVRGLFNVSDILRDEIILNELKKTLKIPRSESIKRLHNDHKKGTCDGKDERCKSPCKVSKELKACCRTTTRTCLELIIEWIFRKKLIEKETETLTGKTVKELEEESRTRAEEKWSKLSDDEIKELLKEQEQSTGKDLTDDVKELAKKKWIQKRITEEGKQQALEEWEKLTTTTDYHSWTDREKKKATVVFKGHTQLFQHWFRVFTWRHEEPFDLESLVKPFVYKLEQINDVPGPIMCDNDLKQLRSSFSKMTALVKRMKKGAISRDDFKTEIKQGMDDTLGSTIDRDQRELLYFGLTGFTHSEMTTLVDELVEGDIDPQFFVEEFNKRGQKKAKNDTLEDKLGHGFTVSEMATLVNEMIQSIKKNITPDLRDFLVFLELRILPYYAQHDKVRKLELIDSTIEEDENDLKVGCTLQDEGDKSALQNVEPSVTT